MSDRKTIKLNINANLFNTGLVLFMGIILGLLIYGVFDEDKIIVQSDENNENIIISTDFEINDYLTQIEKAMFDAYYESYSSNGYKITVDAIKKSRFNKEKYTNEVPFCDVLEFVQIEETPNRKSVQNGESLSLRWEAINNESLRTSCENSYRKKVKKENTPQVSKDIVTIDGKQLISSKKVSELAQLVNTCDIAKLRVGSFMGKENYISATNYEDILKLELDCAYLELKKK